MKSIFATLPTSLCRTFSSINRLSPVPSPLEFRIVQSYTEFCAALRLVYWEYLKQGYLRPNKSRIKLSTHHILPTTTVFIALYAGVIVGTISLIHDSPLGLPMDEAYKPELDKLRAQKHVLAEASMLAINRTLPLSDTFPKVRPFRHFIMIQLFVRMLHYLSNLTPANELVACFNPRHQSLYDFLLLKPLGGLKNYIGANGAPALARYLNTDMHKKEMFASDHPGYRAFYVQQLPPKTYTNKFKFSERELQYSLKSHHAIGHSLTPSELAFIQQCYPSYSLGEVIQEKTGLFESHSPDNALPLRIATASQV